MASVSSWAIRRWQMSVAASSAACYWFRYWLSDLMPIAQPSIIICNIEHIYDGLLAQIKAWEEAGFIEPSEWGNLHVAETMEEVMEILKMKTKQ